MSVANNSIASKDAHNEQITSSDQLRLEEIETNIRRLKVNIACELIEIGKNLIEAKRLVKHGEWANWLEEHAGFTQRTAQNYMRLARTFGDYVETGKLTGIEASKLFLLQEMNPDDRMSFLDTHDVKTMSVREMKDEMAGVVLRIDQPVDEQRVDNSEDIWKVFDRESDPNIYKVPISLLKPIDRYEEFFGPRRGEDYVNYLKHIQGYYNEYGGDKQKDFHIIITRDMTVLDEQEIVRAYKDLGVEEVFVRYADIDPERLIPGMTVEELKIYESMGLHVGRGMDDGPIKLTDSMMKFRKEMLAKGVDVFGYVEKTIVKTSNEHDAPEKNRDEKAASPL